MSQLHEPRAVAFICLLQRLPQEVVQRLVVEEEEKGPPCGIDDKVDGQTDVEDVVDDRTQEDPKGTRPLKESRIQKQLLDRIVRTFVDILVEFEKYLIGIGNKS